MLTPFTLGRCGAKPPLADHLTHEQLDARRVTVVVFGCPSVLSLEFPDDHLSLRAVVIRAGVSCGCDSSIRSSIEEVR